MIEWILHRPPHASNSSEIRVAERLKSLDASPFLWTVIWGYYFTDKQGTKREGDFLILGPAGGLLVLEVKSSLPRHFPETGRWEDVGGDDPIQQLHTEWQGVIHGIQAKGNPPFIEKALCVPNVDAPADVTTYQGIPRNWLVTGNDLDNWVATWLRIFGHHARNTVDPLQKRAVLEAFGQGSLPEEKRAFIDHTEELFERQFTSRFALLDQLSENRQLLIHGGTGTGKTWHALELAFRQAGEGDGRRVLFLTYNTADRGADNPMLGLATAVSSHFRDLTCGRYDAVTLEGVTPVRVGGAMALDTPLLSQGTLGSLALATRLALSELYLNGMGGFFLLDDPFTDMDASRRAAAVQALGAFSEKHQVLFFTCHPEHSRELENVPGAKTLQWAE